MSKRRWQGLIIHHTAGFQTDTVESIDRMHRLRGFAGIGYHFVIEIDRHERGHLKRGRSTDRTGAHTRGKNFTHLGLVVAGNYHTRDTVSEELYQDILDAVRHVCRLYNIPAKKVVGHRDVWATACPGDGFPLERLKKDLAE